MPTGYPLPPPFELSSRQVTILGAVLFLVILLGGLGVISYCQYTLVPSEFQRSVPIGPANIWNERNGGPYGDLRTVTLQKSASTVWQYVELSTEGRKRQFLFVVTHEGQSLVELSP